MTLFRSLACSALLVLSATAAAELPKAGAPLPQLEISDRGELVMSGEDFSYSTWSSAAQPDTVHVVQYFGGTMAASKTFEPFTDKIQTSLEPGMVHVTTIINMDAAMWGTAGFVVSELKKNKKAHPEATMVIDEEGTGVKQWSLGKDGTGLVIIGTDGKVLFFSEDALSEQEIEANLQVIRSSSAS